MAFELSTLLQVSASQKSFDDTFGNYLLHGIDEVFLPEVVSWWPHTLGWRVLALGLLLYLGIVVYQAAVRWQGNYYRRVALKKLDQLFITYKDAPQCLQQLPLILKATALHAYPRLEIAQASGTQWLKILDSKCKATQFSSPVGQQLLTIAYQPVQDWQLRDGQIDRLFELVRKWIKQHKTHQQVHADV
tara:strand:- start:389 stop:955 length:567 start_codon:yes stop_codon:yes gene_type:complete